MRPWAAPRAAASMAWNLWQLSLITPPNGSGGGGSCFPSSVTVALGEPGTPVICWACATLAVINQAIVNTIPSDKPSGYLSTLPPCLLTCEVSLTKRRKGVYPTLVRSTFVATGAESILRAERLCKRPRHC